VVTSCPPSFGVAVRAQGRALSRGCDRFVAILRSLDGHRWPSCGRYVGRLWARGDRFPATESVSNRTLKRCGEGLMVGGVERWGRTERPLATGGSERPPVLPSGFDRSAHCAFGAGPVGQPAPPLAAKVCSQFGVSMTRSSPGLTGRSPPPPREISDAGGSLEQRPWDRARSRASGSCAARAVTGPAGGA